MINSIARLRWMSWVCYLKLWEKMVKRVVVVEEEYVVVVVLEVLVVDRGGLEVYTYYIFVLQLQF
jgi:hypothetical protein